MIRSSMQIWKTSISSMMLQPTSTRFLAQKKRSPRKSFVPTEHDVEIEFPVVYPPEELDPKQKMLGRIVKEIEQNASSGGRKFLLPSSTTYHYDQIVLNIDQLINKHGLRPEFFLNATISNPTLFRCFVDLPEETVELLATLVRFGNFRIEDALKLIELYPHNFLEHGAAKCAQNIEAISACGISAPRQIHSMLRRCPSLIFGRAPDEMRKVAHELGAFFSRKQASQLILNCPEILLKPIEEVEEKYEYVFYQMGAESDELSECKSWIHQLTLEDIQNRHTFLVKCGRYQTPDPKRPQIRHQNAKMSRIIDSNEEDFACNVARVTLEEWMMYKMLRTKEEENEMKERKYERIKPSKRKAFERRFKTADRPDEHVFDVQYS